MKRTAGPYSAARVDANLAAPLYHQVYLILGEKIRSGELACATVLPGEKELSRHFAVSRITVKRALNDLAADGLVTRHRGRGTIVAAGRVLPLITATFDTLMQGFRQMGLKTQLQLLEVATVAADSQVARHLGLLPGVEVQRAVRRRKIDGQPFSYLESFVPAAIAARYSVKALSVTPLLSLLDKVGASPQNAEQWITASAAEPKVASALDVAVGAPLLKIVRVMRSAKNVPVQLLYGHYRPDRFNFHVRTTRRRGRSRPSDSWPE